MLELSQYKNLDLQEGEEWKFMSDYYDGYNNFIVSNYARCYNVQKDRFVSDYTPKTQPYMIWYFNEYGDNVDSKPIHCVVAEMFCKRPKVKTRLVIDHIDGDKHNNIASNLRFISYKENSNAQDVQRRKAENIKKTTKHKNEISALTEVITDLQNKLKDADKRFEIAKQGYYDLKNRIPYLENNYLRRACGFKDGHKLFIAIVKHRNIDDEYTHLFTEYEYAYKWLHNKYEFNKKWASTFGNDDYFIGNAVLDKGNIIVSDKQMVVFN